MFDINDIRNFYMANVAKTKHRAKIPFNQWNPVKEEKQWKAFLTVCLSIIEKLKQKGLA